MSDAPIFDLNRSQRRSVAPTYCLSCDTLLDHDVLGVRTSTDILYLHADCVRALLANADTEVQP